MAVYFECTVCGFDSDEAGALMARVPDHIPICPLCAGDCGHDHPLTFRIASEDEKAKLPVAGVP